ncbi:NADP-dependent 3-hydroxy acid dehydrogenase YdfG [Christiangramia gaetbulicola]|uniref:NADP-dependent 3-hydroxy acid dehydrogenase YdfG n=1 Tax=Christiangramia gaetbulicola TaxID=703340 RepID=A0A2T6ALE4_9FLAO|nr:SDR family oxidoreductase [Christiangramia gaetbulicola]PTX44630.1 NADP-dependent 3-hydroxy acid dehydrogenase YdfG [Christiangramia gaetbulicola]
MKSVIITGANRGIGLETSLAFAKKGYKVFATMRDPDKATELKEHIEKDNLNISCHKMDVDSDESVQTTIGTILKENGPIDVLVNNAGIERHGTIEELDISHFKEVMETNYFGIIRCVKAVLSAMRKHGSGCIINVSSVSGHISNSPLSSYSASKFAVEALSEALAQEVKPYNIRVGIVKPGIIDTDMARDISTKDYTASRSPITERFSNLFKESLKHPTHASLVADKILEIAESDSWKLRHPVGPDAEPFLQWRASMSDEDWIDWNALSDDEWYAKVEQDFGLNARPDK